MTDESSGRRLIWIVVQGCVSTLLIGGVLRAWLQPRVSAWLAQPNCSEPKGLSRIVPTQATASSWKPAGHVATYIPGNAVDGDTGTAWVEDKEGLGIGEYVQFSFDEDTSVELLCVVDGYAASAYLYQKNPRVRGLQVICPATSTSVTLEDAGTAGTVAVFQPIRLDLGPTQSLRPQITSVYAGLLDNRGQRSTTRL